MKMSKSIGLVLCLLSAMVMAEASGEKVAGQKHKGVELSGVRERQEGRVSPSRRGVPRNRQQAYQEMLEKRRDSFKKVVVELEAIKKIAEEENATRTVEALQKMIDKKNAEFKQKMEQFEKQRRQRSKQLQQRRSEQPERGKPAETTEKEKGE